MLLTHAVMTGAARELLITVFVMVAFMCVTCRRGFVPLIAGLLVLALSTFYNR